MQIIGGHLRVLGGDGLEQPVPQSTSINQHIVFVHHRDLLAPVFGTVEGVANHSLHAVGGIHAQLIGDLELGALAEHTTIAAVEALGAFAHHDEVDRSARRD